MSRINQVVRAARLGGSKRARAAAAVEFAVVCPVLVLILFGIVEFGWMFMVRLTMGNAAREGCRVAVLQTTEYSDVVARISDIMEPTGITDYTVEKTDATVSNPMEVIRITLPYSSASILGGFFSDLVTDLVVTCSMRKEGMAVSEDEFPDE